LALDQSALVIVLDTQIEGRSPRPFEIKFGPLIAKFDVLEPDGVPYRLIVDGYVTPTPANPRQTESQ
jgi:hypothetical protein